MVLYILETISVNEKNIVVDICCNIKKNYYLKLSKLNKYYSGLNIFFIYWLKTSFCTSAKLHLRFDDDIFTFNE